MIKTNKFENNNYLTYKTYLVKKKIPALIKKRGET